MEYIPIKLSLEHLLDGINTISSNPIESEKHIKDSARLLCSYVDIQKLKNKELLNLIGIVVD